MTTVRDKDGEELGVGDFVTVRVAGLDGCEVQFEILRIFKNGRVEMSVKFGTAEPAGQPVYTAKFKVPASALTLHRRAA